MRMSTKEKKNAGLEKRGRFHRKNCTASYQRGFKMMSRRFVSTSRSEPRFSRHWVCRKLLVELSRYVYVYTYVYVHVLYNIPTYFRNFEGNVYVWAKRTCTCTRVSVTNEDKCSTFTTLYVYTYCTCSVDPRSLFLATKGLFVRVVWSARI